MTEADLPTLSALANDIRIGGVHRGNLTSLGDAVAVVYIKALLPHATQQSNGQWRVRREGLDICANVRISGRVAYADVVSIKTLKTKTPKLPAVPKKTPRKRTIRPRS